MKSRRLFSLALIALDALTVILAFNLVAWARDLAAPGAWTIAALQLPVLVHFLGAYLIDGYSSRTDMMSVTYASQHIIALLGALLATLLLTYAFIPPGFSLQSSRLVTALSYLAIIPISLVYRRAAYARRLQRAEQRYFIFIGDPASGREFEEDCRRHSMLQTVLVVELEKSSPSKPDHATSDTSGVLQQLQEYGERIDAVVVRDPATELNPTVTERLMALNFSGVPTYSLDLFHQVFWRKTPLHRLDQAWLFQDGFQIAREPVFERLKRISDVVLSLIGLGLFLPLLPALAAAIWLTDRGPVFFRQTRVGQNRLLFDAWKLRTMRHEVAGDDYTQVGDQRITGIGRFLRATRLDEAPQLLNVLRGEMSLIGPRAEWVRLVERYEREIPCYHFRHLVKPGITGWAQVNYPYGASLEDTVRKLEYDLYYIRHYSLILDASIILKTIHVMLGGKGR